MSDDFIPIIVAPSGHATVPVSLEGLGIFSFVLDTGAEGSAVYEAFAAAQGLRALPGREILVGQTGSAELSMVTLPPLTMGTLSTEPISAVVLPPRVDGVALPGIVGLDVFGKSILDFDFPRRRVGLLDIGTRLPELADKYFLHAARTSGDLLTVTIRLNDIEAVTVIDTGARKTRINWALGYKLGMNPDSLSAGDVVQGGTNTPLKTGTAVIRHVDIGSQQLSNAPVLVADLPVFEVFGIDKLPAVILGLDWLEELRMVIHFPEQKVWFLAPE